jgi:cobaltochelatase CobT
MALSTRPREREGYRVYTTKFDLQLMADDIDVALGRLRDDHRSALDTAWDALQTSLLPWRTVLHVRAAEAASRIRGKMSAEQRADTAITLLIDQSGSMRGQKMLFAAATADVVQEFLLTLGVTCEVLGFTTSRWKGGRSRNRWKWRFSPRHPGRLNDLLHIIYRSADDRRASTGGWAFRQMLRPDLPKENIDGEAILWASERLSALPNNRKHLIILSDGAPVDDSTLLENGPTYLADHLRDVVEDIVTAGDVNIAAMGIGYKAHQFYPRSGYVEAPDELGAALVSMIEEMLSS